MAENSLHYNGDIYVPPSDDDESGNEDYELFVQEHNATNENSEISTSQAVTQANTLLYNDVQHLIPSNTCTRVVQPDHSDERATIEPHQPDSFDGVGPNHQQAMEVTTNLPMDEEPGFSTSTSTSTSTSGEERLDGDVDDSEGERERQDIRNFAGDVQDLPMDIEDAISDRGESTSDEEGLDGDVDYNQPEPEPENLQFTPIRNFDGDVEDPDDFANGWEWIVGEDPGPAVEQCSAFPGLVLPPNDRTPGSFFKLLFDEPMFTMIAEETNSYAHKKKQGKNFTFFLLLSYICTKI